jgi:hypothetical protein
MSDLEKIRQWLLKYPGIGRLQGLKVDYYSAQPDNGSIDPSGLIEISRKEDILGNTTVENQYNFALYFVLAKAPEDDEGAAENADWLMDFQRWVQEQSIRRLAPIFGDEPKSETIKAQNGKVEAADEEGTGIYMVQLSINFTKFYEVN